MSSTISSDKHEELYFVKDIHEEEGYLVVEDIGGTSYTISMHDALTYGIKKQYMKEKDERDPRQND